MQRSVLILFLAVLITCLSCSSVPLKEDDTRNLSKQTVGHRDLHRAINSILDDTLLSPCMFGIRVLRAEDGRILYDTNGAKLFHPASNMKLLTTAAALAKFGTQRSFVTVVGTDGTTSDSILHGNIYVKGIGDPLLRTEHFDSLAERIHHLGISRIDGDIVGDVSYFDTLSWGLGWMWDDEPSSDAAFISPLTVNSNSIEIDVRPGLNTGDPAAITTIPGTSYIRVVNSAITSTDTTIPDLDVTRIRGTNDIVVAGRIAPGSLMRDFELSVWKPEFYFLHLLKERLGAHGVPVEGSLRLDTIRGSLALDSITHSLDSVLCQINKPSDNLAAENLLKTLAAEEYHIPGSAAQGLSVVKEYLTSIGIDTAKMMLADGSGLSWYNAISPANITQLLADQFHRRSSFDMYFASLPVAGEDGTLENRMKGTHAEGNVHAKTGSLTGVSSLSGYVKSRDGTMLIVSILSNHFPDKIAYLRVVQDKIMEILAEYPAGD